MSGLEEAKRAITEVCEALKASPAIVRAIDSFCEFLLDKNQKYGNSIYEPVRVFTAEPVEQLLLVRLNDKATRLLKGESGGEDSFDDLLGYLILRKALPIYMRARTRRFSGDDMGIVALTYNRLCDVAGVEVAERVFLATPEGGDVVEDMQKAIEAAAKKPVPGHVVTQSLRDRGLRVGMTYQEVRDNKWTECKAVTAEGPEPISGWCSESDPCSACKFLDEALCKCGQSWTVHHARHCMPCSDCSRFSLASWSPERDVELDEMYRRKEESDADLSDKSVNVIRSLSGIPPTTMTEDTSEGIRAQSHERNALLAAETAQPKKETDMPERTLLEESLADLQAQRDKRKPRIDRKTWHESVDGKHAIGSVLGFLSEQPILSWSIGKLTERSGLERANVALALDNLLETGAVVKNGRAKGMRYAVAGFTDWPAPVPRNRKSTEPPVSESDAEAAHSLDASDSEET